MDRFLDNMEYVMIRFVIIINELDVECIDRLLEQLVFVNLLVVDVLNEEFDCV